MYPEGRHIIARLSDGRRMRMFDSVVIDDEHVVDLAAMKGDTVLVLHVLLGDH